ncbi:glycosyltransferase family 2 protein [Enterococcus pallens]|uniref:Glycosyltransferase 2-like domain-containing protein n=1 Tax=Enterococcus pallens ATCC BAA-351 TaxID=1158607 RepID=R2QBJ5_9ENTE|nr:glycosyltransferase family 2 protein [Enterococcus pallens]EOH93797.1 hypothetical protein UAU_02493 [Enterococcus pallens ATCC BAA-351]EOU24637.1 hypothetical protein I588_00624 [Enterococcus pallens ATCC BAA-351]OJG79541.1 hypothetical protein RV10_GL000668 [Enterococcus pallens]
MEKEPLVSIVIPVYNSYDCIQNGYESLIKQTYKKIEILIIDDGSAMQPPAVLLKRFAADSRVRFYPREHAGPGAARNFGIKESTGEYLLFMDSDDWLDQCTIEELVKAATDSGSSTDVLIFGFHLYEQESFKESKTASGYSGSKKEFFNEPFYECYKQFLLNAPWNKLIRRKLLLQEEIFFDEQLRILEDLLFSLQVIAAAQRIKVIDQAFYHYHYLRPNSLMTKFHIGKEKILLQICQLIVQLTKDYPAHHSYYCKDIAMKVILQLLQVKEQKQYTVRQRLQMGRTCLENPQLKALVKVAVPENRHEKAKLLLLKVLIKLAGKTNRTARVQEGERID